MNRRYAVVLGLAAVLMSSAAYAAPDRDEVQAPRDQETVQAPRTQQTQAPQGREDDVQAPRG